MSEISSLLCDDFILFDGEMKNQEAVFSHFAQVLNVKNRLISMTDFKSSLLERESIFSTNLGNGFSIPHIKSDTILHSSLIIIRLRSSIAWGESYNDPKVNTIILFALNSNEIDQHMPIFSTFARKLVDDNFRTQLQAELSKQEIRNFLLLELNLPS